MLKDPRRQIRIQIFRPGDYDREQIVRAREVIKFAKKVLAESDRVIGKKGEAPPEASE